MINLAQTLGYTGEEFPQKITLKNGKGITLIDKNHAYLDDMGHGKSNPVIAITPWSKATENDIWCMIGQRFDQKNPKKYAMENL